ncbi:MAG: SDR family NAD(P)-dependent oxidoreductase, partial [Chloroflexi bacterium]|nr:SDR family NAD(P)-dependent oxidoreductase [Chloroflexota bacterium]
MEETLSGRVAIVTGGSRGIGQAIVLKLVSAGASVVIGGISDTSRTHSLVQEARGSDEGL